eukprot:SAG22_NODE_13910_length_391_cov_0.698630_2_plen_80_part_01
MQLLFSSKANPLLIVRSRRFAYASAGQTLVVALDGQAPDLLRMQSLLHLQATGEALPPDCSAEQAQEQVQHALRGKATLL